MILFIMEQTILENTPIIAYSPSMKGHLNLKIRESFAMLAQQLVKISMLNKENLENHFWKI